MRMNIGALLGLIPANVLVSVRPIVTAGLAKEVLDVNQYAAAMYAPTAYAAASRAPGAHDTQDHDEQTERRDEFAEPQRTGGARVRRQLDRRETEHHVRDDRSRRRRRRPARRRSRRAVAFDMPPSSRSASVTTGLKCAPETLPSARISAIEPGAGRDGVLEQLQSDIVGGEPLRGDPGADDDRDEERGADCLRTRAACEFAIHRVSSSATRTRARRAAAQVARLHLDIAQHRVDLPRFRVRAVDPHLVLHRVATRDFVFGRGGEAVVGQPPLRGRDLGRASRPRHRGGSGCRARRCRRSARASAADPRSRSWRSRAGPWRARSRTGGRRRRSPRPGRRRSGRAGLGTSGASTSFAASGTHRRISI